MAEQFKLELEKRDELGRRAVHRLRKEKKIPGIFYSSDAKSIAFSIDRKHFREALESHSRVFTMTVGGIKLHAIFKELQYDPVSEEIIHIDLYGVSLKDKIDINIPIVIVGESIGVKDGGILTQNITELSLRCLATEIPESIEVDISELEIGSTLHVSDLALEEFEVLTNPEITAVSVLAPKEEVIEEEIEEEEIEGEEAAEGEETPEKEDDGTEKSSDDKKGGDSE